MESPMTVQLDFVRHGRRTWQGTLLLVVGIAAATVGVQQYYSNGREIAALERELAMLSPARGTRGQNSVDTERLRARIVLANQVVRRKTVPWDALFRDIE